MVEHSLNIIIDFKKKIHKLLKSWVAISQSLWKWYITIYSCNYKIKIDGINCHAFFFILALKS